MPATNVNLNGINELDITGATVTFVPPDKASIVIAASGGGTGVAGLVIDGSGSVPGVGSKGYLFVPYNATITGWTMLADQIGSAQITVKKCPYGSFPITTSIVAALPPTLSSQQANQSSTLTGWTTTITAGDVLEFVLDSASTVTRITLELTLTK